MPALMLLFRRTINATAKNAYVPPTDGMAQFISRHKLPMAIGGVLLFFISWFFAGRTTIFFSAEAESQIEKVFPAPNPFVLVYDTRDEDSVYSLVDNLMAQPGIQSVISYPTLMSQPLTPKEMTNHVRSLMINFKDMMPEGATVPPEALDVLTPEMVQIVYYMRSKDSTEAKYTFPVIARFLHSHVASNPLFSAYLDEEMKSQIALLQTMLDVPKVEEKPKPQPKHDTLSVKEEEEVEPLRRETIAPLTPDPITANPIPVDTLEIPEIDIDRIAIVPFIERLNTVQTSAITLEMRKLTDTLAIRLPMSVNEMSIFIGSTQMQTRLVYGYAPGHVKKMTPLEYVHLLVDDLFKRPGLAGMISEEQRTQLGQRAHLMDLANANASLTPSDMNILLRAFGLDGFSDEELMAIAYPPKKEESIIPVGTPEEIVNSLAVIQSALHSTDTARAIDAEAYNRSQQALKAANRHHGPTRADLQAELFTELVFGGKEYTAEEMAA